MDKRVVITGIGPISSLGIGKEGFWQGLKSASTNIKEEKSVIDGNLWAKFYKHKIDDFNIRDYNLDFNLLNDVIKWKGYEDDYDLLYLTAAGKLAIEDAKLEYDMDSNNIGFIVSHENPGLEQYFSNILECSYDFLSKNALERKEVFFSYMLEKMMKRSFELQTFMPLFNVGKVLGLHGYSLFLNNACASGAYAFEEGKRFISSGASDVVLLLAADIPDVYKYLWFDKLTMYSKSGLMHPFSNDSDGFLMGDGSTGIVLESYDHAINRKADIYAEYVGGGFVSESWKVTLPNIAAGFYEQAIHKALLNASIQPNDIDLIIPHGIGTKVSDSYEIKSLKSVFNEYLSKTPSLALKTYLGHNLGGNVLLEAAALIFMIDQETILPTLNINSKELNSELNILTKPIKRKISYALKATCAFAGFDSALIFKSLS